MTPGQRVREDGSQSQTPQKATEQSLSKITLTEIEDQIQMVERKVVATAILAEKKTKLTDMLAGAREIPRELRITRELPGLAPGCKYSASTRLQVEELTKNQDSAFLQIILADLNNHVMVEAERDLDEALGTAKRKLTTYVPESELKQACLVFDQKYVEMRVNEAALIEKRRLQKRKRSSEPDERPHPKKQRGEQHRRHHRRNDSWQKKAASARK